VSNQFAIKLHNWLFLQMHCENGGKLEAVHTSTCNWTKDLLLSKDCHTKNLTISLSANGKAVGRVTKNLSPGTPILAWFSDETCSLIGMPFLNLSNIKSRSLYACNKCQKSFTDPNPLKIHILLDCDSIKPRDFWSKLFKGNSSSRTNGQGQHHQSVINEPMSVDLSPNNGANGKQGNGQSSHLTDYFKPVKTNRPAIKYPKYENIASTLASTSQPSVTSCKSKIG
jgi:hypothetical protein